MGLFWGKSSCSCLVSSLFWHLNKVEASKHREANLLLLDFFPSYCNHTVKDSYFWIYKPTTVKPYLISLNESRHRQYLINTTHRIIIGSLINLEFIEAADSSSAFRTSMWEFFFNLQSLSIIYNENPLPLVSPSIKKYRTIHKKNLLKESLKKLNMDVANENTVTTQAETSRSVCVMTWAPTK